MSANLGNSAVATGLEKVRFHSNAKECSNYCTTVFISHAREVMLKILQARLQQDMNRELPDVQAGLRKGRRARNQLARSMGFPCGSADRESTSNVGHLVLIPGLGRSSGKEKDYPLQYSGPVNSMNCMVHGVAKSRTQLSGFHFHFVKIVEYTCGGLGLLLG